MQISNTPQPQNDNASAMAPIVSWQMTSQMFHAIVMFKLTPREKQNQTKHSYVFFKMKLQMF